MQDKQEVEQLLISIIDYRLPYYGASQEWKSHSLTATL